MHFFSIFLLLLISACLTSCRSKTPEIIIVPEVEKNHLQRAHLKGNVNTLTSTTYIVKDDSINSQHLLQQVQQKYSYDGFLNEVLLLDEHGDTFSRRIVNYLPTAQEDYWIQEEQGSETPTACYFSYDMNGYKSQERYQLGDSLLYTISYKTNGIGGVTEMVRHLPGYSLTNKVFYNEMGLIARIDEHKPDGKLYKYFTIEYDNFGDEVNRRVFKTGGELIEYTYSKYSDNGVLEKVIFEDMPHRITEERTYSNHDSQNNWMQEVTTRNGDTIYIRKRIINYY